MDSLLFAWESFHTLSTIGIIAVGMTLASIVESLVSVKKQRMEMELKRELLHRGMSAAEIERVMMPPVKVAKMARKLGESMVGISVPAEVVAEIMTAFNQADLQTKQVLATVVEGMAEQQTEHGSINHQQLLAAVRGLCGDTAQLRQEVRQAEMVQTF